VPARVALPDTVRGGDVAIERRGFRVSVREERDTTRIEAAFARRGARVEASFEIERSAESMSVVVPWSMSRFQLTTKAVALPVRGRVVRGGDTFVTESPRAFACLDYGRGVWPYRTRWQWATGAGVVDGRVLGWNLGGTWTRGTGATENAIFDDGRVFPVEDELAFELDATGAPRRIRTRPGARASIDLLLHVETTRRLDVEALVLATHLRWSLGRFGGHIALPGRAPVEVRDVRGFAEDHRARW
jgi:hypothetical protein